MEAMAVSVPYKIGPLRQSIAAWWRGPAGMPAKLQLEWRFTFIRWLGILGLIPILPLLNLSPGRLVVSYIVVLFATLYNLAVQGLISRRPALIARGYPTAIGDLLLNFAMLLSLGGGFGSPFSSFLFVIMVAVAMRFGYRRALEVTVLTIAVTALEAVVGTHPLDANFFFRSFFLLLTAVLASYLREQADAANAVLQEANRALQGAYTDLALAHQELLGVDALKTEFLTNVTHELRTPLTVIRAFAEMLADDDDPEVRSEFLQIITAESERLTRLINDVLDIAKIEAGQMDWHVTRVDFAAVLQECVNAYAPLIAQKGLRLESRIDPALSVIALDRDRVQQVVANLLNNALKFTAAGVITLSASRRDDFVWVAVSDTGIGLASVDQARIFEKFQQVGDTLTNKPRGTGLGLGICKEIIAFHQGRFWVESVLGEGSTFHFTLPIAAEAGAASAPLAGVRAMEAVV